MNILIVEDDFTSRNILKNIVSIHGQCDLAVDGQEAVDAFRMAWEQKKPYHLILLDILLPKMTGIEALKEIRKMEKEMKIRPEQEVKVIMITALDDPKTVFEALYRSGANSYVIKPITVEKIIREMKSLNLFEKQDRQGVSKVFS